jgi:outer membrane lipoprotein SlyB
MRNVKVKESDKVEAGAGTALGGIGGAIAGSSMSNGRTSGLVGGTIAGALIGTVAQQALSTSKGVEYIVKVDTSKLSNDYYEGSAHMRNALAAVKTSGVITVVQAPEGKKTAPMNIGQSVLVVISDKRTMIIPNAN